jgi:mono/diheme cytochrome c family protein
MSMCDLTASTRADLYRVESRVGWAKRSVPTIARNRVGTARRTRLCPPYEPVNLSIFAFSHLSQIKDLAGMKNAKTGKIHILYGCINFIETCSSLYKFIAPSALFLAGLAVLTAASPPKAGAQGREQRPPAFTEEQVQRGKSVYQKNCQECHGSTLDNGEFGGAPLKGSYFRQHWGSGDVSGLFGYMNALMPADRPGGLTPQAYADVTAFLLSNNGYTAGTEELTADEDAQRKMTMKK